MSKVHIELGPGMYAKVVLDGADIGGALANLALLMATFAVTAAVFIFGVLGLYASRAPGLDTRGLETALVYSDVATEMLLDGSLPGGGQQLEPGLGAILGTHAHVYQAQGMVMVELGVSLAEALARMRAHAWSTGQDLTTLAGEIVAGRAMPTRDDW